MPACSHVGETRAVEASGWGCKECLERGMRWVHLRICMSCGHVGCCDSSQGKHATRHHRHAHHPIIRSYEHSETWGYCYVDQRELTGEELPTFTRVEQGPMAQP
jgi:hypothetical protein